MDRRHPPTSRFAVCLNDEGYPASLEVGKLYRVVPDEEAAVHGYIRVVDESGEDYAYSTERFHAITLPQAVEKTLLSASQKLAGAKEQTVGVGRLA